MTAANPTDPNQVRLTGENSFIRLAQQEGGPQTTRVSHWRVHYSPGGGGHVLYIKSELMDNDVRIYSDNIALARWLQGEIESMLFPEFADQSIPVINAVFDQSGDSHTFWTESVENDDRARRPRPPLARRRRGVPAWRRGPRLIGGLRPAPLLP